MDKGSKVRRSIKPYWLIFSLMTIGLMMLTILPAQAFMTSTQPEKDGLALSIDEPEVDTDGGAIFISETALGSIDYESDADLYTFQGLAGEAVRIEVNNTAGALDPAVTLFFDTSRLFGTTTGVSIEEHPIHAPLTDSDPQSPAIPQAEVSVEILSPLYGTNILIPYSPTNIQVSGKAGVTGTGSTTALEVAIVIDISGSIDDVGYQLEADGVREILKALDPDGDGTLSAPVALIQFDDIGSITAPLTRSRAQVESGLGRLRSDGGTHYDNAFQTALQALAPSSTSDTVTELTLFFSDGDPNYGTYTPPGSGGPLDQYPADGIRIDTFGIGSYVDPNILTTIAQSTGGTYTAIPTFNDIPKVTASLPGIAGLQSVVLDIDGDGIGDVTANVGVDGSFTAVVPIYVGRNTITAIATATDTNLAPATDTIVVFGLLGVQVDNNVGIIHDDDSGAGTNALIKVFQLPFSGTYSLLVTASENATSGNYELALKPIDPDSNAAAISLGSDYTNLINTRSGQTVYGSAHGWRFSGFSPNGAAAAISEGLDYVYLVNTQTGDVVYQSAHGWTLTAFSSDGKTAAISEGRDYVNLVDTQTGEVVYQSAHGWTLTGFSPDGKTAAISEGLDYVNLVNTQTGDVVYQSAHGWTITGFSPDGETAAISEGLDYVNLVNTQTGDVVHQSAHGWTLTGFSPDGETAAISEGLDYVNLVNTKTGDIVRTSAHGWTFTGFSPDGETAAISEGTDYVNLVNTTSGKIVYTSAHGWTFTGFSPDGETAAISEGTDYVNLVNTRTGNVVYTSAHGWTLTGYSPDGGTAAISEGTDYVNLVDTGTGDVVYQSAHGWTLTGFSPDGETAAISEGLDYVNLVNTQTGDVVDQSAHGWTLTGFSPDGETAAISEGLDYVNLVNTKTGDVVYQSAHGWTLTGFSPDGETAAISEGTDYVYLVNTISGNVIYTSGHGWTITGFSPDGDTAVISLGADYVYLVNTRGGGMVYSSGNGWSFTGFSFDRTRNVATHAAHNLYAPMVTRIVAAPPAAGISGLISYQGSGIGDIDLELRFYDGSIWSTMASTKTGSDGQYLFSNVPSLGSGQQYYVRYGPNDSDYRYLYDWYGPFITTYTAGGSATGGNFDIANFSLLSPNDYALVSFPVTFTWEGRGLISDTFRWHMFDFFGGYEWDSGNPAGAVSYTLSDLPSDAGFGEEYYWDVYVHNGPDSYGTCIDYYAVTFSSSLLDKFLPGLDDWLVDRRVIERTMKR